MKSTWILAACALLMIGTADAAPPKKKAAPKHKVVHRRVVKHRVVKRRVVSHASGAETSLIGIRLFDTGVRVVQVYGTPDDIEAVNVAEGAVGGGGDGGGGRASGPGGGSPSGGGNNTGKPGLGSPSTGIHTPLTSSEFDFANPALQGGRAGGAPTPQMGPSNSGGGGGNAGGGGGDIGSTSTERVTYTRWIYNRGGSKYGFVVDKFNRVIQIEAIGLANPRVHTRAGITFGSKFDRIMKTYGAPDGYEIGGNTLVVRYLSRKKVAFRLNRLGEGKSHVVTGIVVAAGK